MILQPERSGQEQTEIMNDSSLDEPLLPHTSPHNQDDHDDDDDDVNVDIIVVNRNSAINNRTNEDIGHFFSLSREEYPLDPKRFVVLTVFGLNNFLGAAMWISFATISDSLQSKFSVTEEQVNWLSMIFMALYGPATAFTSVAIRKFGLRETVLVSTILTAVGGLLRWWSVYFIPRSSGEDNDNNTTTATTTKAAIAT
jgi:hypothetical protein